MPKGSDHDPEFIEAEVIETELARLRGQFETLASRVRAVERRLSNRDFVTRAPAEVVARDRSRRDELAAAVTEMRTRIEHLEEAR